MKILNFGSCNVDFVYSLNHIVNAGETETSNALNIFPGGKGLNQSIAMARAGASVSHAGCIGSDGKMLSELLKDNGVDISHIKFSNERNGHAIIQVSDDGENCIFLYPGSNNMITESYIDEVLADFGEGDIIVLQNEINLVDLIIQKAYEKRMCIVFNPSPCNDELKKINLKHISYLLLNELEAQALSACDEAEKSLDFFNKNYPDMKVILTLGKNGCIYSDGTQKIRQSAFFVKTVDTTAAGDTFTGYFISCIASGIKCDLALKTASAAAAIAVSRNGAAPSIPTADEVNVMLSSLSEYKRDSTTDNIQKKIEEYIKQNLKNSTPKGLADYLGYSASYTQSLVKKLYNEPLSKLVQDRCCAEAAKMLTETALPISEIIKKFGYENESFFRSLFKKKYGKNLSEYRKSTK